ncbi:hypothetical protein, partial [Enterococcus casseliflavus]|uniref:hypothetical protein n=1 Tax=Enterococcus casseliflavus TaxID=37734 RepID=UPI003D0E2165
RPDSQRRGHGTASTILGVVSQSAGAVETGGCFGAGFGFGSGFGLGVGLGFGGSGFAAAGFAAAGGLSSSRSERRRC